MKHILIVEDDLTCARLLTDVLLQHRWQTTVVSNLKSAYQALEVEVFDLALVDRVLPDGDGIQLMKDAADLYPQLPIIALTQLQTSDQRIRGLETGADDYLPKPFNATELALKIGKWLAVVKHRPYQSLRVGPVSLLADAGVLILPAAEKVLRRKETEILACLIRRKHTVVTREAILETVWPEINNQPDYATLDVYIRRIRMKLNPHHNVLRTIRGFGYMVTDREANS